MRRLREGGTRQSGQVDGVHLQLERITPCSWYAGAEYLRARGRLTGKTGRGERLVSQVQDVLAEVRFGYTLSHPFDPQCSFITPFAGWGYFEQINDFNLPSPLPCKFTETFDYVVVGFLSGVNFTSLLSMGINFKARFMLDGRSQVSNDPGYEAIDLMVENELQYRFEVPFTYAPCNTLFGIQFQLMPFYEFRHFGGRQGYPFNYKDTKFYLVGGRISLQYCY